MGKCVGYRLENSFVDSLLSAAAAEEKTDADYDLLYRVLAASHTSELDDVSLEQLFSLLENCEAVVERMVQDNIFRTLDPAAMSDAMRSMRSKTKRRAL